MVPDMLDTSYLVCGHISSATKSRLASRETGDGLTGTDGGGSLDEVESVARWSRETSWRLDRVEFQSKQIKQIIRYDELSFIR